MPSREREHAAAALRRSWLSTALTAGATGALLLLVTHGPITAYLDISGALALLAAIVAATAGIRRATQVSHEPTIVRDTRPHWSTVPLFALLSTLSIAVAAVGVLITR